MRLRSFNSLGITFQPRRIFPTQSDGIQASVNIEAGISSTPQREQNENGGGRITVSTHDPSLN